MPGTDAVQGGCMTGGSRVSADASEPVGYAILTEQQKTMGLELAGIGLIAVDYRADTVTLDPLAARMFGLPPTTLIARAEFHKRIHPADWPQVQMQVDRLLDPECEDVIKVAHRTVAANGATRWVRTEKRLYRDAGAARTALTGIAAVLDVTAEMKAQETTRLLIGELAHRTKNIIAVVAAIARLVMRDGDADTFLDRFLPRLANLAQNQEIAAVDGRADLRRTLVGALAPFAGADGRLAIDGPDMSIDGRIAQTFAIVTHELATNAVKYGAWSRVGGQVRARWHRRGDGHLVFLWTETGGPRVVQPLREGFGSRILTRFATVTLSATASLTYQASGIHYELAVPAEVLG